VCERLRLGCGHLLSPIRVAFKLSLGFFFCLLSMLLPAAS
jgi:hypothetical protein